MRAGGACFTAARSPHCAPRQKNAAGFHPLTHPLQAVVRDDRGVAVAVVLAALHHRDIEAFGLQFRHPAQQGGRLASEHGPHEDFNARVWVLLRQRPRLCRQVQVAAGVPQVRPRGGRRLQGVWRAVRFRQRLECAGGGPPLLRRRRHAQPVTAATPDAAATSQGQEVTHGGRQGRPRARGGRRPEAAAAAAAARAQRSRQHGKPRKPHRLSKGGDRRRSVVAGRLEGLAGGPVEVRLL